MNRILVICLFGLVGGCKSTSSDPDTDLAGAQVRVLPPDTTYTCYGYEKGKDKPNSDFYRFSFGLRTNTDVSIVKFREGKRGPDGADGFPDLDPNKKQTGERILSCKLDGMIQSREFACKKNNEADYKFEAKKSARSQYGIPKKNNDGDNTTWEAELTVDKKNDKKTIKLDCIGRAYTPTAED